MLFRLERQARFKGESVIRAGYKWIEVLAIVPRMLVPEEENEDDMTDGRSFRILNDCLCRTDDGIHYVDELDLNTAVLHGEYREAKKSRA